MVKREVEGLIKEFFQSDGVERLTFSFKGGHADESGLIASSSTAYRKIFTVVSVHVDIYTILIVIRRSLPLFTGG